MTEATVKRRSKLARFAPDLGSWRTVLMSLPNSGRTMTSLLLGSMVRTALTVPLPLIIKDLFDKGIPEGNTGRVAAFGAIAVALFLVASVVEVIVRRIALRFVTIGTIQLRQSLHETISEAPIDTVRERGHGGHYDVLGVNVHRVELAVLAVTANAIPASVLGLGLTIVVIAIEWRLVLIGLAFVPVAAVISFLIGSRARHSWSQHHLAWGDYMEIVLRAARLSKLTRASSAEAQERRRHLETAEYLQGKGLEAQVWNAVYTAALKSALAVASMIVVVAGAALVANGSISLGRLISFYAALSLLRGPVLQVIETFPMMAAGKPALAIVNDLKSLEERPRPYPDGATKINLEGFIRLADVTYAYEDGKDLFKPVNVELQPGQITALIGANGVGKSTLVSLILGLREPASGALFADNIPYAELDTHALRHHMAVLVQELMLDDGSVSDIISYGLEDVDPERIRRAAKLADAASVIDGLPDGYDTIVGRNGVELSLGQHQRLAIARALAREPAVLLLDEPTNHLDPEAVRNVLDNLRDLDQTPAMLVVSHHHEIVEWADNVVIVEAATSE